MSQSPQPTDPPSSTTEDDELTLLLCQKVWQGKIPTKISLAANESKSFTNTTPLYVSPLPYAILFCTVQRCTDVVAATTTNTILAMLSRHDHQLL